ncbi:UDP-glucose 4-epimerase GalE [Candidatus Saccharibacteria bacterium]|nr:UDP-glucose 4-epimerase GalE [Candidatus Saccharibacteria bacterium]
MKILVTGGAGYIGSHILVELYTAGHTAVVVDNLSNSSIEAIKRVEKIVGCKIPFHKLDVRNRAKLYQIFAAEKFDAVIHLAGLKAVGESVAKPLDYYANNIDSTLVLLDAMKHYKVYKLIFSSSATVYGTPEKLPLTEDCQTGVGITNPYGWTKFMIEQILIDVAKANPKMQFTLLRYFNPIGAHPSGTIGEDPNGIPNNLLPYVAQVAVGKLDHVNVFGDDYDTPDGTGVRDYIHVMDLANGHVVALQHMKPGIQIFDLGTGHGVSVLEIIDAFTQASGKKITYKIIERRDGDVAACYASAAKANKQLGWKTARTLEQACQDSWRWQSKNPNGYN